jgi:hypothetical protein
MRGGLIGNSPGRCSSSSPAMPSEKATLHRRVRLSELRIRPKGEGTLTSRMQSAESFGATMSTWMLDSTRQISEPAPTVGICIEATSSRHPRSDRRRSCNYGSRSVAPRARCRLRLHPSPSAHRSTLPLSDLSSRPPRPAAAAASRARGRSVQRCSSVSPRTGAVQERRRHVRSGGTIWPPVPSGCRGSM